MGWTHDQIRRKDERLPKRSETKKQEGCRKRGRPQLRWEDCVKRDLRKAKKSGEKRPTTGTSRVTKWKPASPLQNGNQRKNNMSTKLPLIQVVVVRGHSSVT